MFKLDGHAYVPAPPGGYLSAWAKLVGRASGRGDPCWYAVGRELSPGNTVFRCWVPKKHHVRQR